MAFWCHHRDIAILLRWKRNDFTTFLLLSARQTDDKVNSNDWKFLILTKLTWWLFWGRRWGENFSKTSIYERWGWKIVKNIDVKGPKRQFLMNLTAGHPTVAWHLRKFTVNPNKRLPKALFCAKYASERVFTSQQKVKAPCHSIGL